MLDNELIVKQSIETRIRVYREAVRQIENNEDNYSLGENYSVEYSLCLLLPCILWDLSHYLDDSPNGMSWLFSQTVILFPELKEWLGVYRNIVGSKNQDRLSYLKKWVVKLEK